MNTCPECGATEYKEGRACLKHNSEAVCVSCCYKCEHYKKDIHRCMYGIKKTEMQESDKIYNLAKLIEKKEKAVKHYRNNKMPYQAMELEAEVDKLKYEKSILINKARKK